MAALLAPIALALAESARVSLPPAEALARARHCGALGPTRSLAERMKLRARIRAFDARFPDGGNCFRRVLAEAWLDPLAARELVRFGLRGREQAGVPGHVWFAESDRPQAAFEVTFDL